MPCSVMLLPNRSTGETRASSSGAAPSETLTYEYDQTTGLPVKLRTNFGGRDTAYVSDTQYTRFGELSVLTMANAGSKLTQQAVYYDAATRRVAEALVAKIEGDSSYLYDPAGNRLIARDPTGASLYLGSVELRLAKATNKVSATRYYSFGGRTVVSRTPRE